MILRFGEFVLDTDARLLRRGGQPIHLRAKTFDLLLLLVTERPKALSKSDLIERLWPATYVHEANLSNAIGELRKALGDHSSESKVIRTVHAFGYAFIAPVTGDGKTLPPARLVWGTTVLPLTTDEAIIGRDDTADIVLPETTVSRRHARLAVNAGQRVIEDLASQNGTWVNERRVTSPTPLADGDRIRLGRTLVTYRDVASALTTERIPE